MQMQKQSQKMRARLMILTIFLLVGLDNLVRFSGQNNLYSIKSLVNIVGIVLFGYIMFNYLRKIVLNKNED